MKTEWKSNYFCNGRWWKKVRTKVQHEGLGRMSLPRNRTLENGITQLQYINNGEPLSSLQFHLQNTGSVTSVPGSPTGGVRGGGATPVLSSGQRGGGYGRPSGAERFSGLLGVLSTGDGSEPDHRAGQQYAGATQWHVPVLFRPAG